MRGTPTPTAGTRPEPASIRLKRWLSLRAYGLVTSALFGATTPPHKMRARFDRFARVSRGALQSRFPKLVFEDHRASAMRQRARS